MAFKVGDTVVWRDGMRKLQPGSKIIPLGVAGCVVLELHDHITPGDMAKIKSAIFAGGEAWVWTADLCAG